MKFKTAGDKHFTEDGRFAEITLTWCSQPGPGWQRKKVNGPEDSTVAEMMKEPSTRESLRN